MITLQTLLDRLWEEHAPPPVDRRPWCAPIQPGDVVDRVMKAVARYPGADAARLGAPGSRHYALELPGMDGYLEPGVTATVSEHFATEGWAITQRLTGVAQRLAVDVRDTRRALPRERRTELSPRDISAWAVGVAVRPYADGPAMPDEEYLVAETKAFWQHRTGPGAEARAALRISAADFARSYQQDYDDLWNWRGDAAGSGLCPVQLGLGRLCRPPLTALESSWRSGTDRSVLSRYRHYIRRRDWCRNIEQVAEIAGLSPDRHIGVRIVGATVDDLARTELGRACAPLGLRLHEHHALVTTTARAVVEADITSSHETGADTARRGSLRLWAEAAEHLCTDDDPVLHDAVVGYARGWAGRDPLAAELAALFGDVVTWSVQVELGVLRRLWHRLHGREVEWEAALRRIETARLLRGAFTWHLRELLAAPIDDPRVVDDDPAPGPQPDDPRLAATLTILAQLGPAGVRTLLESLRGDHARWREAYLAATDGAAGMLDADELRYWLAGNLAAEEGETG